MKGGKNKIKAIIFDIGNVLIFFDHKKASRVMAKKLGGSEKKVFAILSGKKGNFINFYEKGASEKESWELFKTNLHSNKDISPKTLGSLWNRILWPNRLLLSFLKKLRKNYKLGLLSNLDLGHKNYILKKYNLKPQFDAMTFSCDIGSRKPFPKIYQTTLYKLNSKAKETLYIDDLSKNINGAKNLGMPAILFKNNKQLFKQLEQFGVRI